ncbi:hypothetical protein IF188_15565 [Microbacterium sp. NEAU-LLC]|uniref:Uncharacterized protein n=1 Tax=Microbacterium helvum TaxID=2773713 RepID=A0ABR8NR33_9MICO|nr:hypothetical protein [Microbacterium helvum]MBD3943111.1 hypothetical protein [Microbacterium helvum]
MAAQGSAGATGGPVRPAVALTFATIGFAALSIFGLGMVSLATGEDVIATPGLGQIPGVVGMILAVLAFAGGLWAAIAKAGERVDAAGTTGAGARQTAADSEAVGASTGIVRTWQPSFWGVVWTTAAAFLAYIGGVLIAAVATGTDLALATGVAGRLATSWFGAVVAGAAFVSAWAGIALVRTRARRPRWPWENPDEP